MGVAIIVNDVNWAASAVANVTLKDSEGGPEDSIPAEVRAMYTAYIEKSGRAENASLLKMMSELYESGLLQKCTGLFYLASEANNLSHAKYDIVSLREIAPSSGISISIDGAKANGSRGFYDNAGYNMSAKGFCMMFMISVAPTGKGFEWGGQPGNNLVHCFCAFGSAQFVDNTILRWGGTTNNCIIPSEDSQIKDGIFTMYLKGTATRYLHKDVDITKTAYASTQTNVNPYLLNYDSAINSPSTATMKMYATFNNDLTTDEVTQIHSIFDKYRDLL